MSPSFFISTIKASRRYSFHFSSEFAISERSYLHIYHTFTKETSKILQRQEDQFASYPTLVSFFELPLSSWLISSANHSTLCKLKMGRFKRLVKTPALIELFKEKYHIPQEVVVRHCTTEGVEFDRKVGEVVIPMIAFIKGGMTVHIGKITRDYLHALDSAPTNVPPTFLES